MKARTVECFLSLGTKSPSEQSLPLCKNVTTERWAHGLSECLRVCPKLGRKPAAHHTLTRASGWSRGLTDIADGAETPVSKEGCVLTRWGRCPSGTEHSQEAPSDQASHSQFCSAGLPTQPPRRWVSTEASANTDSSRHTQPYVHCSVILRGDRLSVLRWTMG